MDKVSILIVDDRPENLLTLESLLEEPGLDIVRADSGDEALSRTLDHDFAIVLLDVNMPGMDGFETAELMRGNRKTRNIPIIFVTAQRGQEEMVFKGYESGAVDYLVKPLQPNVLQSKVRFFLDTHRQRLQLEQKTRELDAKLVELEELQQLLEESNLKLKRLSSRDALTGLPNRRSFDDTFAREWQHALRDKEPLSLIIMDIDHFKKYNDTYGHVAGDYCLQQVAHALEGASQRAVDLVARYGGEEFTVVLPDTDAQGAETVAAKMMRAVSDLGIEHGASPVCGHVTISLGVATIVPTDGDTMITLVETADKMLYQAKNTGRNRYVIGPCRHDAD